jgi:hypothetical protein
MLSTCPACKKQIEHEDFLFEVICDCGSRFNPFMNAADDPLLADLQPAAAPEWQEPPATTDFSESNAAFAELKEYAEGGLEEAPTSFESPESEAAPKAPAPKAATRPVPTPASHANTGDVVITAGDGLPGYRIENYFTPISASVPVTPTDANPLGPGFEALAAQAAATSATAVVAVRWVLSPDGTHAFLSGTPVYCVKET